MPGRRIAAGADATEHPCPMWTPMPCRSLMGWKGWKLGMLRVDGLTNSLMGAVAEAG